MQTILCPNCVYQISGDIPCCLAFPDGIPESIITGEVGHDMVRPDQQGNYVFVPISEEDPLLFI